MRTQQGEPDLNRTAFPSPKKNFAISSLSLLSAPKATTFFAWTLQSSELQRQHPTFHNAAPCSLSYKSHLHASPTSPARPSNGTPKGAWIHTDLPSVQELQLHRKRVWIQLHQMQGGRRGAAGTPVVGSRVWSHLSPQIFTATWKGKEANIKASTRLFMP